MTFSPEPIISVAQFPDDVDIVRTLFREYAGSLDVDLSFQAFEEELSDLPGKYAQPEAAILLARRGDEVLGCIAMRPMAEDGACEMKRLYLRPAARGLGVGRLLADAIIEAARAAGYRRMVLDTLESMAAARNLYTRLGFGEIPPYYTNPLPGVLYLGLTL